MDNIEKTAFEVSQRWRDTHPSAMVGVLVVAGVTNMKEHPELERRKRVLEQELRSRFSNSDDIKAHPSIRAYTVYYRRFDKTYHLVQQLKTLVVNGRALPVVSGLVDAMFMAEMKNLLLTAGHDMAAVIPPVAIDAGLGTETYIKLNHEPQAAKANDMMVVDGEGILSTVIHGPDYRSRITLGTRSALYVVYAPHGIGRADIRSHLSDIANNILLFSPSASIGPATLLSATGVEELNG